MYKPLNPKQYKKLSHEKRVEELRKYLNDSLDNIKAVVISIAGCNPEVEDDIGEVLSVSFEELPTLISSYNQDSVAHAILKYRLENQVEGPCDDALLKLDALGEIIAKECESLGESQEDTDYINEIRDLIDNHYLILCDIFCLEDLKKSFSTWRP
jgi:hypothetical protein